MEVGRKGMGEGGKEPGKEGGREELTGEKEEEREREIERRREAPLSIKYAFNFERVGGGKCAFFDIIDRASLPHFFKKDFGKKYALRFKNVLKYFTRNFLLKHVQKYALCFKNVFEFV